MQDGFVEAKDLEPGQVVDRYSDSKARYIPAQVVRVGPVPHTPSQRVAVTFTPTDPGDEHQFTIEYARLHTFRLTKETAR